MPPVLPPDFRGPLAACLRFSPYFRCRWASLYSMPGVQFVVCRLAALGHHLTPSVCKPSHHLTTGVYQHHPLVNFHLRVSILPGRCEIGKIFRVGGRIFAAAVSLAARFSHPPRGKLQIFATRRLCRYQDYLSQRVSGEIFKFGELVFSPNPLLTRH